jgi:CRP/FNR family transcriptional regulator, cyclic AMP receptor protein
MVSIEDLKKIIVLQDLPDSMLEGMGSLTQLRLFGDGAVIFEEGQEADVFYMLLKGKLILEVEASESVTVSLGAIKPGYSFGWSSLLPGFKYSAYGICVEPCEVLAIRGDSFLDLLKEDFAVGYLFMERVVRILKGRLERRTGQFLKVMSKHPDIQKLLGIEESV